MKREVHQFKQSWFCPGQGCIIMLEETPEDKFIKYSISSFRCNCSIFLITVKLKLIFIDSFPYECPKVLEHLLNAILSF